MSVRFSCVSVEKVTVTCATCIMQHMFVLQRWLSWHLQTSMVGYSDLYENLQQAAERAFSRHMCWCEYSQGSKYSHPHLCSYSLLHPLMCVPALQPKEGRSRLRPRHREQQSR